MHGRDHPKRRLRNFLLDWRFQLKYTTMVVLVTVAVAGVLGYIAYDFSRGQTEALTIEMAAQPELDPNVANDLRGFADAYDRRVLLGIVTGILLLAFALGFTGIVITHKVVGPAFKMRFLMREVARGNWDLSAKLRKGDELQDVFESFGAMLARLRQQRAEYAQHLELILEKSREARLPAEVLSEMETLHNALRPPPGTLPPAAPRSVQTDNAS